jgi:hypothetical protein
VIGGKAAEGGDAHDGISQQRPQEEGQAGRIGLR